MKPRFLGVLAALASAGFGWWLVRGPHTSRELLLVMVAWVLGFWVATGIRSPRQPAGEEWVEEDDEDEEYD